jgi:hypothetical protein
MGPEPPPVVRDAATGAGRGALGSSAPPLQGLVAGAAPPRLPVVGRLELPLHASARARRRLPRESERIERGERVEREKTLGRINN